jgi:hypothetical protein
MKKYITIIIITLSFFSCKAQLTTVNLNTYSPSADKSGKHYKDIDGNFNPFLGTWEGIVSGSNITFRVELFKDHFPPRNPPFDYSKDRIQGKYYLIEDAGEPFENIICIGENMAKVGYVIIAGSGNGINMQGSIYDTCIPDNLVATYGALKMDITGMNTAHWTITRKGMFVSGMEYVLPTDIILTKQ